MYKQLKDLDTNEVKTNCICRVSDGATIPFDPLTATIRSTSLSGSLKATHLPPQIHDHHYPSNPVFLSSI